jgi:hypothetical protein
MGIFMIKECVMSERFVSAVREIRSCMADARCIPGPESSLDVVLFRGSWWTAPQV